MKLKIDEIKDLPANEVLKKLDSSNKGLSSSEAENRLKQYGFNELEEKKVNPLKKFLSYFWGPIPWMIEVAAVISGIIHRWEDFGDHLLASYLKRSRGVLAGKQG